MPDEVSTEASATPVPVDTQSAPITGGLTPPAAAAPPPQSQVQQAPPKAPPGQFFSSLSHAFTGALLGTMAGREKTTGYQTDDTGKQTPITSQKTSGDQLRDIARSALLGLAAGSRIGPQKSGMGAALAGLGAGAEDAVDRSKQTDLLQRKQSTEEFERGQQAMLNKATNAHILVETARARNDLLNSTLETQGKFASLGQDALGAAVAGGNRVVAQDMHMNDIMQFKKDHPEYLNYTPLLTKVTPQEGAQPDSKTGEIPTDRYYSLIEGDKDVKVTQPMIDHLKAMNFPGAENLQADQAVPFNQFKGLWYQGLKMYNDASAEPKNWEEIEDHDAAGNSIMVSHNKITNASRVLVNPLTQKPMTGKDDPLAKIERDPTELAGDKAAAAIPQLQNWLSVTTDPQRKDRIQRAIGVAQSAQHAYEQEKMAEANALNVLRQGDPMSAGKLLADGSLTLTDLKTRGSTPEFIVAATNAAKELSQGKYNPADEVIAEQVAKSPQLTQFFGSANSLINKGGTLDQLVAQGARIPNASLPVLNTAKDWTDLASGKGPLAGYAATVLGVADDYSKVMSGGVGSDTARDQALKLFAAAASPQMRAAAINSTRAAVLSQRNSRIGTNQFLQRRYGDPVGADHPQNGQVVPPPTGATHSRMAADGKTAIYLMPDKTVEDAAGNKYDPNTLQRIK